jgi:hypothetical protein
VQQACGGSEPPGGTKLDASADGKDASLDRRNDLVVDSKVDKQIALDGEVRLDATPKDGDTAPTFEVGRDSVIVLPPDTNPDIAADGAAPIDVPAQDTAPVLLPDAQDTIPTIVDTGEERIPESADTMVENPDATMDSTAQVDLSEVATADSASDTSQASFSCVGRETPDAGVLRQLCYDFSNASSALDFDPEAGTWVVADGTYNASEISSQVTCDGEGTVMTSSVLRNLSAQDLRLHAKLFSVVGPDKVIVLRSRPGGNRIELNFRATFTDEGEVQGGDLSIYDVVNCASTRYAESDTTLIPHSIGQAIVVDIQLIGTQLKVVVDGAEVLNHTLSGLSTTAGTVGFATFREVETQFDDLLVEVLK